MCNTERSILIMDMMECRAINPITNVESVSRGYLDVDDGPELAEVLVELGDVVQLPGDLANLQLGVDVVVPLGERGLVWVVETRVEIQGGGT